MHERSNDIVLQNGQLSPVTLNITGRDFEFAAYHKNYLLKFDKRIEINIS
ncbi:MAG: hypothetical protein M3525_02175 [Acidobacteriota bacterium]|nr:hypothetical protein [Acidobacteriota bacterium]